MKTVAAVLVILCAYLHVADNLKLKPDNILKDTVSDIKNVVSNVTHTVIPECVFGVESVSMVLYNRDNPYGKKIGVDEVCDGINLSMPIVFLVHGFISNPNYTNSYKLSEALVEKGVTVFSLDWTDAACTTGLPLVKFLAYPAAVINTRKIGELMASYVVSLNQKCSVPVNNIRFFGHSLGAHVCGFASKHIQESGYSRQKIPLLIGFDPAQPLFMLNKCEDRLCKQDADLVIALHTSTLGMTRPIGHTDFYFNGGSLQPKCPLNIACSHSSAVLYLAKIIEDGTCKFPSVPMSYPDVIWRWKKPNYPQSNTIKCTPLDNIWSWIDGKNETFDKDKEQVYYTFVNSDTFCANDNFSCQD
ncbi:phospholipase A1-like [Odontomachus brunneus]|uniref:phospholipase A1-like n=1 Tax=Odontomachus brunneus TaxID=486640 RepID=UPI0013F24A22|nr:phospholipase A1-like [Odontomachus brunneus]